MYPKTMEEIILAQKDCKKMLTKRALVSGVAGLSPIVGPDIAADMALLLDLLPRINRRFGFSPEQIDSLDEKTKIVVYQLIKGTGKELVGKYVTKELIRQIVKKLGIRLAIRSIGKYIPFIGLGVSGAISFAGMRYMGNLHIRECVDLATNVINGEKKVTVP
jgi:uncharacterized protein (DUF697 family)